MATATTAWVADVRQAQAACLVQDTCWNGDGHRVLQAPMANSTTGDDITTSSTFAGSHARFKFHTLDIESGSHYYYVRQELPSSRSLTVGFLNKAGTHSYQKTDAGVNPPLEYNQTRTFLFLLAQGFDGIPPKVLIQSTQREFWDGHRATTATAGIRIAHRSACKIQEDCFLDLQQKLGVEPFWSWLALDKPGTSAVWWSARLFYVTLSEWGSGFPVTLHDGYATSAPGAPNRVHVATYDHNYYFFSPQNPLTCPGSSCWNYDNRWTMSSPDNVQRWGASGYEEHGPVKVFMILPGHTGVVIERPPYAGTSGDASSGSSVWHVCTGSDVFATPCNEPMYNIQMRAFLPFDNLDLSATMELPYFREDVVTGADDDDRTCSRSDLRFRMSQSVTVVADESLEPDGELDGTKDDGTAGITKMYLKSWTDPQGNIIETLDSNGKLKQEARDDTDPDPPYMVWQGRTSTEGWFVDVERLDANRVQAHFKASGHHPNTTFSCAIDWDFKIIIDETEPDRPRYSFASGSWRDPFPGMDLYINNQLIIDPCQRPTSWEDEIFHLCAPLMGGAKIDMSNMEGVIE